MKKVLSALLLLLSVFAIVISVAHNLKVSEKDRKDSAALNSLYSEYNAISFRVKNNQNAINSTLSTQPAVFFVFNQISDNVIKTAKPLLDKYGYTGIVVVTDQRLPGKNGNMSQEELLTLTEQGWEIAIGFENGHTFSEDVADSAAELAEYIDGIKNSPLFKDKVEITTVIFSNIHTQYQEDFDGILKSKGISAVISHNTDSYFSNTALTNPDELLKSTCLDFNTGGTIQSNLTDKILNYQSVAIISNRIDAIPENPTDISVEKYQLMLDFVSTYTEKSIYFGSIHDYYLSKLDKYRENHLEINNLIESIEADTARIKEIKEKIDQIITQNS